MGCSNVLGTHNLKLVVIGKSKKPRSFKGKEASNYFDQKGTWMDSHFSRNLFHKCMNILNVVRLEQKTVLLLNRTPSHPVKLKSEDGKIFVAYLPSNLTALIQPIDKGVISSMKRIYRCNLLQKYIDEGHNLTFFWKQFTLLDVTYEIAAA